MIDLNRIICSLEEAGVSCCIVGGYAVALHGAVRGTIDLDLVIDHTEEQFIACEGALRRLGLEPRLPVTARELFRFRSEYIERRNLIAWSFINPHSPLDIVDIIITHDLRSMRTIFKKFGSKRLPVLAIDDLIRMKEASARPQDLEDVKMLRSIQNAART